jgi:hypothetical protein
LSKLGPLWPVVFTQQVAGPGQDHRVRPLTLSLLHDQANDQAPSRASAEDLRRQGLNLLAVLKQVDERGVHTASLTDEKQIPTELEEVTVERGFFTEFEKETRFRRTQQAGLLPCREAE